VNKKPILILGDVIAFIILTVIGFATHGETGLSYLPRMAAAFVPTGLGWFLLAPWFGLFDETVISSPKALLRIPFAFLFIAPFAAVLRSVWLGEPVSAIFTFVLAATNAAGMMIWRWVYLSIAKRSPKPPTLDKTQRRESPRSGNTGKIHTWTKPHLSPPRNKAI
jgi:hypothetical protein